MRVLVCGGRDYADYAMLEEVLGDLMPSVIIAIVYFTEVHQLRYSDTA